MQSYAGGPAAPNARRNALNTLSGEQWLYFTKTVLPTSYNHILSHELRKQHGANKPPQLLEELIQFFTKPGERVLDPFMGVGSTLLAASLCGRFATGIELVANWVDIYRQVAQEHHLLGQEAVHGDCLHVMGLLPDASYDFVVMDPPYGLTLKPTMSSKKAVRQNRKTDFSMVSADPADLSNSRDYEEFLDRMQQVLGECCRVLVPGKYLALMMRNNYIQGEYIFTTADLARRAKVVGLVPKGEKIWSPTGVRLRPYGMPYAYIPNIVHTTIVIFQKPKKKAGHHA